PPLGPLLLVDLAEDDPPPIVELKLRLHLVLQVVDRLPGGVERLDFEIRPVVAVLTKEEPHPGVHERAFADPIVAVDGGVGPAQLQSELADTFEVTEGEADEPHAARPLAARRVARYARASISGPICTAAR